MSEKHQLAGNWIKKSEEEGLVPKLLKTRNDRTVAAGIVQQLGPIAIPGYVHPHRIVILPDRTCTCFNWQDENFPCVHAIGAAIHEGLRIEQLYDTRRLSNGRFRDTYSIKFLPWPITATLHQDLSVLPPHQETPPERIGKRGLKPSPKPKHNRKEYKKAIIRH
ncbi:Hypothetical protein PHPALM_20101 [Phytophthora palmivora]|uniref:SWIM-type domain-containing protein n=1 Tax=Phytophthora palmivora TaxID=4796 RepID=A0A2P4XFR9_9STRA|nr:Hypothetical protein PHPALM_20101 [Phytophthora palmivora]